LRLASSCRPTSIVSTSGIEALHAGFWIRRQFHNLASAAAGVHFLMRGFPVQHHLHISTSRENCLWRQSATGLYLGIRAMTEGRGTGRKTLILLPRHTLDAGIQTSSSTAAFTTLRWMRWCTLRRLVRLPTTSSGQPNPPWYYNSVHIPQTLRVIWAMELRRRSRRKGKQARTRAENYRYVTSDR